MNKGFRITAPPEGNEVFNQLHKLVGEPVKTERGSVGMGAYRRDTFSCGCVRSYLISTSLDIEVKEDLAPCPQHQSLKALGGRWLKGNTGVMD